MLKHLLQSSERKNEDSQVERRLKTSKISLLSIVNRDQWKAANEAHTDNVIRY